MSPFCLFGLVLSSQDHFGNLVSLDTQVQKRRVSTVFTLTLTLTLSVNKQLLDHPVC